MLKDSKAFCGVDKEVSCRVIRIVIVIIIRDSSDWSEVSFDIAVIVIVVEGNLDWFEAPYVVVIIVEDSFPRIKENLTTFSIS